MPGSSDLKRPVIGNGFVLETEESLDEYSSFTSVVWLFVDDILDEFADRTKVQGSNGNDYDLIWSEKYQQFLCDTISED